MIYSTELDGTTSPPATCMRPVSGSATFQVFGWFVTRKTAAFLVPMTLVNLTSLVMILIVVMRVAAERDRYLTRFDPTDPTSLILLHDESGRLLQSAFTDQGPWDTQVVFGRNEDGIYGIWPKNKVSLLYLLKTRTLHSYAIFKVKPS